MNFIVGIVTLAMNVSHPYIQKIDVDLSTQKMYLTWSDNRKAPVIKIASGRGKAGTSGDPCANQTEKNCTPVGTFHIKAVGGEFFTNTKGDRMAWYSELSGPGVTGRGIGTHGAQVVTGQPESHGCIRVGYTDADNLKAKMIHDNVNEKTLVIIKGKAKTKAH